MRSRISALFGAVPLAAVMVLAGPVGASADEPQAGDVTALVTSFDGLNHFADRVLNPSSIEPPEQGLCVGNGYVVESVASAIAIYSTAGSLVQQPVSLNSFYGYPPVFDPSTQTFGPQLNDPSCYFDAATQRWFHTVLTVEIVSTGPFASAKTAVNHVDIAVSQTADPTGAWSFFKLPARNDCAAQPSLPWGNDVHACLGDFPRIGANAHGFYVTTNDYSFFTHVYRAASVYAFSKRELETSTATAAVTRFDTTGMVGGSQAGFTVWPAQSSTGGVEFFLSSNAADEVNASHSRTSRDLIVWALSNTASLESGRPSLQLSDAIVTVDRYSFPPRAHQKDGPVPLATCLNDTTLQVGPTSFGCWRLVIPPGHPEPPHDWAEGQAIDTGDTRMQQVTFAGGVLYGALDTAATADDGSTQAGLEWFAVRPHVDGHDAVDAELVGQGYVVKADTSLSFPALAVAPSGRGAIAFSLMGPNDYPSAAYVPFDVRGGTGDIQVAAAGVGPDDGYTNYATLTASPFGVPPRARWGDSSVAVVVDSDVWMASEYIGQSCTFAQWLATGMKCNNTRAGAANWDTRITEVATGG